MTQSIRLLVCLVCFALGCGDDAGTNPDGGLADDSGAGVGGTGGTSGSGGTGGTGGDGGTSGSGGAGGTSGSGGAGGDSGMGGSGGIPVTVGWTELSMQPNARVIHVSNTGDDNNDGAIDSPKATLRGGYDAVREGEADWVLLERGGQWTASAEFIWSKSGPLADDAGWMRLGAYGDESAPRPRINSGARSGLVLTPGYQADRPLTHLAVTDIHFIAQDRIDAPATAAPGVLGVQSVAVEYGGAGVPIRHVLLENVKIEGYGFGYSGGGDVEDLRIRRCIFTEIFSPGGDGTHGSGVLSSANGLLLEENVFYRIQHPDMPAVTAISTFAHSAYITADAQGVISRGNIILKTTEGFMQRAGGVYERNISAFNEIAHLSGQAWGVTPTAGGVTATVHDNLMLNAGRNMILGNTAHGTILRNVIVQGPEGSAAPGIDLVPENAQGGGVNVGVHDTRFEDNHISGGINYDASDTTSFSGIELVNNETNLGMVSESVAAFMTSIGLSGDIDEYARDLIARDRATFQDRHQAEAMLNYYREARGLPALQ